MRLLPTDEALADPAKGRLGDKLDGFAGSVPLSSTATNVIVAEATAETEMGILTDQVSWYRYRDGGGMNMGQGATLEWSLEGYEPIWELVAFGDAQWHAAPLAPGTP